MEESNQHQNIPNKPTAKLPHQFLRILQCRHCYLRPNMQMDRVNESKTDFQSLISEIHLKMNAVNAFVNTLLQNQRIYIYIYIP
jgi:hypothetical protein